MPNAMHPQSTETVSQRAYEAAQVLFDDILGDACSYAEFNRPSYREAAVRTLAEALSTPIAVPDGMCIVPREPTNAMTIAGAQAVAPNIVDCPDDADQAEVDMRDHVLDEAAATYRAMIAAATGEAS